MLNTEGFSLVAQVKESALQSALDAAWKSGGDNSGEGVIPEAIDIGNLLNLDQLDPPLLLGPFPLLDANIQIPQSSPTINLRPEFNGAEISFRDCLVTIQLDAPVSSLKTFKINVDLHFDIPVGSPDNELSVGILLSELPDDGIQVDITSGDPLDAILDKVLQEYVDEIYLNNPDVLNGSPDFKHVYTEIDASFLPYLKMKLSLEIYNDKSDNTKSIVVQRIGTAPSQDIELSIPIYLKFYDISVESSLLSLLSVDPEDIPVLKESMAITGRVLITAAFALEGEPRHIVTDLSNAEIYLTEINPAEGELGDNYITNADNIDLVLENYPLVARLIDASSLEELIVSRFQVYGSTVIENLPSIDLAYPTENELEDLVSGWVRDELLRRKFIEIWAPDSGMEEGGAITDSIENVTTKVLPNVLAIAINRGADSDINGLGDFIPATGNVALGIDESIVEPIVQASILELYGKSEFPIELPKSITDGRNIKLNSVSVTLADGVITIGAEVTWEIIGCLGLEVDASIERHFGLRVVDHEEGGQEQKLEAFLIGAQPKPDTDVDFPLIGWLIAFLASVFTFGVFGGIIATIVTGITVLIVKLISGRILGNVFDKNQSLRLWPERLANIGNVEVTVNPGVDIFSTGILIHGNLVVESFRQATMIDFANSHGPYFGSATNLINFSGGTDIAVSEAMWDFGDDTNTGVRNPQHSYTHSGFYIAKLRIQVNEAGGLTTRHFAPVRILNRPPEVSLDPPLSVIREGVEFDIIGTFRDIEWLDTHTARFDFGDNSGLKHALVEETNEPPAALGTARTSHTYCDSGTFEIRLTVEDNDGGIGQATTQVVVENVAPVVTAPEVICVLKGQSFVLHAEFTDQGWCDKHTALWELGDCVRRYGVVVETNEPPEARGVTRVCHNYKNCGTYQASVIVTDDDGGQGKAKTLVQVVELQNPSMERGFRTLDVKGRVGDTIANGWHPFRVNVLASSRAALNTASDARFLADHFVCSKGQRAQRIDFQGTIKAGIYQRICANPGWDYEFSAEYHLPTSSSGRARIGIDPTGGLDPSSQSAIWINGDASIDWQPLAIRTTALAQAITVFMGGIERTGGTNSIYWDNARLCSIQPFCQDKSIGRERCIDFERLPRDGRFMDPLTHEELLFTSLGKPLATTDQGDPFGIRKLAFPDAGVRVDFSGTVNHLRITVKNSGSRLLHFTIFQKGLVTNKMSEIVNGVREITLSDLEVDAFSVTGGQGEACLIRICVQFID